MLLWTIASLLVLMAIDYLLAGKAEFLNAWSILERLMGRNASTGESWVYHNLGAAGELSCVLLVNLIAGTLLSFLISGIRNKSETDQSLF